MAWHGGTSFDPPLSNTLASSPQQASPTSASPLDDSGPRKRKRSSVHVEFTGDNEEAGVTGTSTTPQSNGNKARHTPGVKRACNDCRQQKLRCNVIAGPGDQYKPCDRCVKHDLKCSIDNDFKRLGKRAAHEEMVKELEEARARLAEYEAIGITLPARPGSNYTGSYATSPAASVPLPQIPTSGASYLGPNEAAASRSLLDLSQGYREMAPSSFPSITAGTSMTALGGVTLTDGELAELYNIYFNCYHPFLPVLDPTATYKDYYGHHQLLHWTIAAVAARRYDAKPGLFVEMQRPLEELLWTTLSQVPQTHHVCKALALLCAWPLPTSSTSQEATMMLTGIMFQLAMQYGLHRPSHAQDFSRFRIELREEDIADRMNTWAAVNIVAQNVSTGLGQPPLSRWAWYTYGLHLNTMKTELQTRCQIEKFCDMVTRTLYTMQRDHVVEVDQAQRGLQIEMYSRELNELEVTVLSTSTSDVSKMVSRLYLKAAALHLRLTAFFDKPTQKNYNADLRNVYIASSALLTTLSEMSSEHFLFVPRYIEQMMLAAAVTLMKILNSFYANYVDVPQGRTLFGQTVTGLRKLSVRGNDLPQRLAEVMAQLWQSSGASEQRLFKDGAAAAEVQSREPDDSLQLKVRCRSSLSVLYDAIWRWRERAGQAGRDNLEHAVAHPTAVVGPSSSSASDPQAARLTPQPTGMQQVLAPSHGLQLDSAPDYGMNWDAFGGNAVFDTLSWALDGNLQLGPNLFGAGDALGFDPGKMIYD